ncbi:MAG: hypothetical protein AAF065_13440 [Verrucomicrobiota bacterium]
MNISEIIGRLKQYPLAVICSVLLIVFVVLIFLRSGVAAQLSIQESDLNSRLRTIDQNKKNSTNLEQDLEDLEILVEQIDARLFNRDERAINTNFFYAVEDRVDVVISSMNQLAQRDAIYEEGGPRALKLHSTLVFDMSMRGNFENILRFFYELHRVDPLIRIAEFQVSGRGGAAASPDTLNAQLRVLVFAEKD